MNHKNVLAVSFPLHCVLPITSSIVEFRKSSSSPEKHKRAFTVSFVASTALCPSGDLPPTNLLKNLISTFQGQRSAYTVS
jgi:hypothetical protein